jgi:hypothetical protein
VVNGALPDWLVCVDGRAPALLVAPHGGRRPASSEVELRASRKVNDLHTGELTLELARALGAPAIVNRAEDRNRLDLNRVSHVRARAPWFLRLLLESIQAQITAHGQATVLFIHGWNAIQPSCDVGIGARVGSESLVAVKQGVPTVPLRFLPRLVRFAEACRRGGIDVTVGDRYPAAGRDNMLQVFTSRYADDPEPRVRELARLGAAGKICAVQLEFAVPLRWPGPLRRHVMNATAHLAFPEGGSAAGLEALRPASVASAPPDRIALEFHDGAAGVGGFAAIERASSGRRHARLLLCVGPRRICLFTGEDAAARPVPLSCMNAEWRRGERGEVRLDYDGPCLTFARTDPFLDLETGLAEAELSHLRAELWFRPVARTGGEGEPSSVLGRVEGRLRLGDWSTSIATPAVLQDGPAPDAHPWRERRALRIPLGSDTFLSISSHLLDGEIVEGHLARNGRLEPILSGRVTERNPANGLAPQAWRIEAVSRSATLRVVGHVTHAIPVVRPAANGRVFTVFGLARFGAEERVGFGTFEQSLRVGQKETMQ